MGVRVTQTDMNEATLYDSTGGYAFGPVFETQYEAEEFLEWFQCWNGEKFQHGNETLRFTDSIRVYRSGELMHIYHMFKERSVKKTS